jgi:hypothetical protein
MSSTLLLPPREQLCNRSCSKKTHTVVRYTNKIVSSYGAKGWPRLVGRVKPKIWLLAVCRNDRGRVAERGALRRAPARATTETVVTCARYMCPREVDAPGRGVAGSGCQTLRTVPTPILQRRRAGARRRRGRRRRGLRDDDDVFYLFLQKQDGASCSRRAGLQQCRSFVEMCIVSCLSAAPACLCGRGAET